VIDAVPELDAVPDGDPVPDGVPVVEMDAEEVHVPEPDPVLVTELVSVAD